MRITGGTKLRHNLKAPAGSNTRPTSDKVREALFNILLHHSFGASGENPIANACVLDAFCGTGALAFEALSRGAAEAVLFDKDREALDTTASNIASLGFDKICKLIRADATKPPKADKPCALIFLDPPYHKQLVPKALAALEENGWLAEKAFIVIETAKNEALELPEKLKTVFQRAWGDTEITILTN
jgi:16S rRNA (guanine966-N2)-methyltransferase